MIIESDLQTCLRTLANQMTDEKGVRYVLVQKASHPLYTLYGLEDPDLNWQEVASGGIRVVLCASLNEMYTLVTTLSPREEK